MRTAPLTGTALSARFEPVFYPSGGRTRLERDGSVMASTRSSLSSSAGVSSPSSSTSSATPRFSAKARLAIRDEAS